MKKNFGESSTWAEGSRTKVGSGWNFLHVFSG